MGQDDSDTCPPVCPSDDQHVASPLVPDIKKRTKINKSEHGNKKRTKIRGQRRTLTLRTNPSPFYWARVKSTHSPTPYELLKGISNTPDTRLAMLKILKLLIGC
ncbi:hypothetical protein Tco_0549181 [Tanacetum coccineum]